ncbi:MAG: exodeoxyribonuclease small subunit [Deltaproteobacteria bacterium]|nr:exodeoxyribonuclease small subunit [Deltaproteobacteria bacterium]
MANAGPPAGPEREVLSFEDALDRLEAIVDRLERGELALEDALATFEEGVGLSRRLGEQLGGAERRVEELLREGAGLATRPLDAEPD